MEDNTTKMLGLEDVIVKNIRNEEEVLRIELELPRRIHRCPCCESETDKVHDYRTQIIKDIPAFGKDTYIHLKKRRYVCPKCGKRFYEKNDFLPRYYRMTGRKITQIIDAFRDTISATFIAKKQNVSVSTVLRYFDLVSYSCKKLPRVLSIDEFKGNAGGEKYQSIITDAENRHVMDILPNRKKADLVNYFMSKENRKDVEYVVMDMNQQFRDVARTCFPKATIVIDRYHVTRQAIWAMERVRKNEQKKLSPSWRKFCKHSKFLLCMPPEKLTDGQREKLHIILGLSARLEHAYDLKNEFLSIMHSPDSKTAGTHFHHWLYAAERADLPEFSDCTRAVHNWGRYILNSFDCPYSNGFTEGCNNKTKVLKRVCYGVSNFNRFRSRILHCAS